MPFKSYAHALAHVSHIDNKLTTKEQAKRKLLLQQFLSAGYVSADTSPEFCSLLEKDILQVNDQGQVVTLYPFSLAMTTKKVISASLNSPLYGMCAIDAMGIYHMIQQDITIYSICEASKKAITLQLSAEGVKVETSAQELRVLHVDLTSSANWATSCCSQMHFFNNSELLQTWVKKKGCAKQTYYDLSLTEAFTIAKKLFYLELALPLPNP